MPAPPSWGFPLAVLDSPRAMVWKWVRFRTKIESLVRSRTGPIHSMEVPLRVSANRQPVADGSEPAGDEARSLAAGLARMDCAMTVKSCSRRNGLVRKPVAPAGSCSLQASTVPLMRTTGNSGRRECNISIISRPSITGIATSVKTRRTSRSGCSSNARASAPFAAVRTR
jgi:hypothetical protein